MEKGRSEMIVLFCLINLNPYMSFPTLELRFTLNQIKVIGIIQQI